MKAKPKLWRAIEKTRRKEVTAADWRFLGELGMAQVGPADNLAECVADCCRALRALSQHHDARATPATTGHVRRDLRPEEFTAQERAMASAVATYLGAVAHLHRDIKAFRHKYFDGGTLSRTSAWTLFKSCAGQVLTLEAFHSLRIPLLDHTSEWPKVTSEIVPGLPRLFWELDHVLVVCGGRRLKVPWRDYNRRRMTQQYPPRLILATPDSEIHAQGYWPGSVISDIADVGESLSRCVPWAKEEASWFALTGEYPTYSGMKMAYDGIITNSFRRSRLTIWVFPWISARTVTKAYLDAQSQILKQRRRTLSVKHLTLFEFVMKRLSANGTLPAWRQLTDEWNGSYPHWYYSSRRNLSRDFTRVRVHVIPNSEPTQLVPDWFL